MSRETQAQVTTLAYLVCRGKCLFIRKTRKGDMNLDKYLGIGGHMESAESPEECIIREIYEESGLTRDSLATLEYRGHVTFVSDLYGTEYMHVFCGSLEDFPELSTCDEGDLVWIGLKDIYDLPVWEGDKIMFDLLFAEDSPSFFSLKLCYEGDRLASHSENIY
jgi:8-oxo-dGTP diphosphatase